MSDNTGGPAFPCDGLFDSDGSIVRSVGISVRDYFAAKAMQGLISSDAWREDMDGASTARAAYAQADYMLAERAK